MISSKIDPVLKEAALQEFRQTIATHQRRLSENFPALKPDQIFVTVVNQSRFETEIFEGGNEYLREISSEILSTPDWKHYGQLFGAVPNDPEDELEELLTKTTLMPSTTSGNIPQGKGLFDLEKMTRFENEGLRVFMRHGIMWLLRYHFCKLYPQTPLREPLLIITNPDCYKTRDDDKDDDDNYENEDKEDGDEEEEEGGDQ